MASVKQKLTLLLTSLIGIGYKIAIDFHMLGYTRLYENREKGQKIIVSLTSYGRRVSSLVYYAIISILRQTVPPDKIVLYLDSFQWNERNIPNRLRKLKKYGLIIKYTETKIKSYKKLVHALEEYPDEIIITIDDDMYYRKDMICRMIEKHNHDSTKVYSNFAHLITVNSDGKIEPYNKWIHDQKGVAGPNVFLLGVGSCIYRRKLLYKDVTNESLFLKLAPIADDIWFYFMEVLQGSKRESLSYRGNINYPLDTIYQKIIKKSSLFSFNCGQSQNDVQFKKIMDYYRLKPEDFLKKNE